MPPLTITVASHEGWPALRNAYAPMREQAEHAGVEILFIDASENDPPDPDELGPGVRWIKMPGADITEMRMRGYREARGPIVAMTEDHVDAAPDWVEAILRAHAEHPDAAAIGGTVINGSTRYLVDWASFYAGHSPSMAPLPTVPVPYINGANLSYKQAMLIPVLDGLSGRAIETLINGELSRRGHPLYSDHRIRVVHHQSRGYVNTMKLHYYAGMSFEGTRRMDHPEDAKRRAVRAVLLPLPRVAKRLVTSRQKGEPIGRLALVTPSLLVLETAQCPGEFIGALRGPGRSAENLH